MARFTKELRQQIVEDYAKRHKGSWDAHGFLAEVRKAGSKHPAYEWFEWNDDKAALEFRLDQARDFARGLVIRFEVQTVHRGRMRVTQETAPLVLSPLGGRRDGGGYMVLDPNDPDHMEELRRQAAQSLRWFLSRYSAVLAEFGISASPIERIQDALESAELEEAA